MLRQQIAFDIFLRPSQVTAGWLLSCLVRRLAGSGTVLFLCFNIGIYFAHVFPVPCCGGSIYVNIVRQNSSVVGSADSNDNTKHITFLCLDVL